MQALDKIGQEIKVGSIIAYGHAMGRSAGIRIGKVLSIRFPEIDTDRTWMSKGWSITVIGVDDDWNRFMLNVRKGNLQFPERIIVLTSEQVPAKYKELLDSYV